ncbi:hypothetical protein MMC18_002217 [Xylographa bjoerkii]|nr:hypothetical protein [Xylographa bjoerkii]
MPDGDGWERHPAIRIVLKAQLLYLGPPFDVTRKRRVFGVLLHEMVHAYIQIKSKDAIDHDEQSQGLDYHHGRSFQTCCWAVTKRTDRDLGYKVFWYERYDGTGHGLPNGHGY